MPRHPAKQAPARRRPRRPPSRSPPDLRGVRLSPRRFLQPFRPEHGPTVVAWVRSVDETAVWAALDRLVTLDDLHRWHADADVVPFVFVETDAAGRDQLIAYGELWEDRELDEAELARLVVDPERRGRGHGRALTRALADEARRRGFAQVWLRVVPENGAAIRAYVAAGFVRAKPEEEAEFNAGQPRVYVWMRAGT